MTTYKPEGMLIDTAENKSFLRTRAGIAEALSSGKILEARAHIMRYRPQFAGGFGLHERAHPP